MQAQKAEPKVEPSANTGAPQADQRSGSSPAAQIRDILDRARAGDSSVLPDLERLLAANPRYWDDAGDLIRITEQLWIDKIGDKDLVFGQSLRKHVERWKRELAAPSASPLERLLAARIAVTWLAAQHAEVTEAASQLHGEGHKIAELRMRRAESANRRLLAAIKTMATVRRLIGGLRVEIHHHGQDTPESGPPMPTQMPGSPARQRIARALAGEMAVDRELVGEPG